MLLSDSPRPGAAGAGSRPARWKSFALLAGRLLLVSLFLIAGLRLGVQRCRVPLRPTPDVGATEMAAWEDALGHTSRLLARQVQ